MKTYSKGQPNTAAEEALRESERSKASILSSLPGMAYRCKFDRDWTMEYVSDGCLKLTGYKPDDLIGSHVITYNDIIDADYRDFLWYRWVDALAAKEFCQVEYTITTASGEMKWVWEQGQGVYDEHGEVVALEGLILDITDRKKREEEILYLSNHDVLTGLYNRNFFEQEKARLDTVRQLPISVIVGDVDGLKLINDALGHREGDELLVEISRILASCCRKEDILARTGGDEFSILLPRTAEEDARAIAHRINGICRACKEKTDSQMRYVSISVGYAAKTEAAQRLDSIIKNAENFMYKRKLLEHKSLHGSIIASMRATMFEKSHETEAHAERLVELSEAIGKELGLNDDDLGDLKLLATLHDIGKISIDDHILAKPGKLTEMEWFEIRKHPEAGYRIAMASPELHSIAECILTHHERYDGSGYPQGLCGESIPLLSRIIAVADAYDAMVNDRPYRKAMPGEAAMQEIVSCSGSQFDPAIVDIFVKVCGVPEKTQTK